jgi:hypothetical protein
MCTHARTHTHTHTHAHALTHSRTAETDVHTHTHTHDSRSEEQLEAQHEHALSPATRRPQLASQTWASTPQRRADLEGVVALPVAARLLQLRGALLALLHKDLGLAIERVHARSVRKVFGKVAAIKHVGAERVCPRCTAGLADALLALSSPSATSAAGLPGLLRLLCRRRVCVPVVGARPLASALVPLLAVAAALAALFPHLALLDAFSAPQAQGLAQGIAAPRPQRAASGARGGRRLAHGYAVMTVREAHEKKR